MAEQHDGSEMAMDADEALLNSIRHTHGRNTCDDAGRPLTSYLCEYHQGYSDGYEQGRDHRILARPTQQKTAQEADRG